MRKPASRSRVFLLCLTALMLLAVCASCSTASPKVPPELAQAIAEALPDLQGYELVTIDDAPMVSALRALAASDDSAPLTLMLPAFDASGRIATAEWRAYHVNVRAILVDVAASDFVVFPEEDLSGPSMTFRGFPDWSFEQTLDMLARAEDGTLDPELIQPSVLNLIGERLEGARFGGPNEPHVTVLDAIDNVLEVRFGRTEAERLAGLVPENYLLYRQANLRPTLLHGEQTFEDHGDPLAVGVTAGSVEPLAHVSLRVLRPVMIADDTIYSPFTRLWLVDDWFARVDAAANRQNAFFWLANIAPDVPGTLSTLPMNNNRILLKTEIAGYRVLTEAGWAANFNKPDTGCGGDGTYIDRLRRLSDDAISAPNEYWMWWTRLFGGGGCAYIATLGQTPFRGAVGWTSIADSTVDWNAFVFMHETGHVLGGTHRTADGTSPETVASHRCKLLGVISVGNTGPSLMSYADGDPTFCFAATPSSGPKRNLTQVAEYLNGALR